MCGAMKYFSHETLAAAWALPVLIFSLFMFPFFTSGDQEFYRKFYSGVSDMSFVEGFVFYKKTLGTSEAGYFLLTYLFSAVLQKDVLFSLLNFVLFQQVFSWLLRHDVSRVLFPMVYFNFYLIVLAFSAERLKLSLLFFLIAYSASGLWRILFLAVSVMSHVQVLIMLLSAQVRRFNTVLSEFSQGRIGYGFVSLMFLIMLMLGMLFVLREHILSKFLVYYDLWGGGGAILKPLFFTLLTVCYASDKKLEALLASLPLVLCAYLIGEERIVIFSYFIFVFYALQVNRGINVGIVITGLYFFYKGLLFVSNVVYFGDGFASIT